MKKKATKQKMRVVRTPKPAKPRVTPACKVLLGERVQAFTAAIQQEVAEKFGISSSDLTVTVHFQIKDLN